MSRSYLVAPRAAIYTGAALVAALGLFAMPAHAAEQSTSAAGGISVNIVPAEKVVNLTLQNSYKATTHITVTSKESNGFRLTMAASGRDLVNKVNDKYKITAVSEGKPAKLSANQWGYSFDQAATEFSQVPTEPKSLQLANVLPNNLDGCASISECTKSVTFAANIDNTLPPGNYSTTVSYTVTATSPKPHSEPRPSLCQSGNKANTCRVDLDKNMIPVKYTGSETKPEWTSVAIPENAAHQGEWYDYKDNSKKDTKWANAVTVKDPKKYQTGKDMVVEQSDILGYWVYIPRYAYEVMRRDATDKFVEPQNFNVRFETADMPEQSPQKCQTGVDKDYRTECGLSRTYSFDEGSTWATHPAFTFGKKKLNGIWFAKFQTTGDFKQPTVLPNQKYLSGSAEGVNGKLAELFAVAKSLGGADEANVEAKNSHNLANYSSRIINNNDWGAAAYLSASQYGAGFDKVEPNNQSGLKYKISVAGKKRPRKVTVTDDYGITGCGAMRGKNGKFKDNSDGGEVGTQSACSSLDSQLAYNGTTGQLASTTNNPTGIYDMSGGGKEVVAAAYSDDPDHLVAKPEYKNTVFDAKPPYTNLYHFASINRYECAWETCGGQALHEVEYNYGAYLSTCSLKHGNMWNVASGVLAGGCDANYNLWFARSGDKGGLSLFLAGAYNGKVDKAHSFRVVLGDFS